MQSHNLELPSSKATHTAHSRRRSPKTPHRRMIILIAVRAVIYLLQHPHGLQYSELIGPAHWSLAQARMSHAWASHTRVSHAWVFHTAKSASSHTWHHTCMYPAMSAHTGKHAATSTHIRYTRHTARPIVLIAHHTWTTRHPIRWTESGATTATASSTSSHTAVQRISSTVYNDASGEVLEYVSD
jgi:hypothetical protein